MLAIIRSDQNGTVYSQLFAASTTFNVSNHKLNASATRAPMQSGSVSKGVLIRFQNNTFNRPNYYGVMHTKERINHLIDDLHIVRFKRMNIKNENKLKI